MLVFLIAFLIAALIAPLVIRMYRRNGWLDDPIVNSHVKRTHTKSVPRGGGLVVMSAILLTALIFLEWDRYLHAIMLGAIILTIVGVLDDIFDLHPIPRLLAGFVSAFIVVGTGIGIAYITNPWGPGVLYLDYPQISFQLFSDWRTVWVLADIFALLFITWNMNIVNWSKGVDGQMPGFVAIASIFIGLLSYRFIDDPTQFNTAHLSFIVAGAFAGFLVWNWYPQKLMPGYGAGSLAGYFLAVLAILSGAKVATTLMVIAIPTADAIFTISRRLLAGKSPFWGDRGHLHHKLLDVLGWGKRRVAIFYWLTSLVMGSLSLVLDTKGRIITIGLTFGLVFIFLIWAKFHSKKSYNRK